MAKSEILKLEELESQLTPEVATAIKALPKDKQQVIVRALTIQRHSGPLPDGETLRIYSEVIPDGGNRVMATVETQLIHRIDLEKESVKRSYNQSSTGQWMAFFIAIVFGVIAWDLAKSGQEVTASIIGGIDLVGLVAVFITGRVAKK